MANKLINPFAKIKSKNASTSIANRNLIQRQVIMNHSKEEMHKIEEQYPNELEKLQFLSQSTAFTSHQNDEESNRIGMKSSFFRF